jgi:hypothetical protein
MNQLRVAEKSQYDQLQRLLIDEYALVHLNPKSVGVEVPEEFKSQEVLTLKLSKLYRGKLDVTRERVLAELLFEEYFTCIVPLAVIWGMTSVKGETYIWPSAAPTNMQPAVSPATKLATPNTAVEQTPSSQPSDDTKSSPPKKRKHLTRIK